METTITQPQYPYSFFNTTSEHGHSTPDPPHHHPTHLPACKRTIDVPQWGLLGSLQLPQKTCYSPPLSAESFPRHNRRPHNSQPFPSSNGGATNPNFPINPFLSTPLVAPTFQPRESTAAASRLPDFHRQSTSNWARILMPKRSLPTAFTDE